MRTIQFADGSSLSMEENTMEGLALAVERAVRGFRSVAYIPDGGLRIGLPRRYYLPVLWTLTQENGIAEITPSLEFMGALIFLVDG